MIRIRTGYSFRTAVGSIEDVITRLKEIGSTVAPITDRNSTFGFVRWTKAAKKAELKPIYGVELATCPTLGANKPPVDMWTFIAIDELQPMHELIGKATTNPGKDPMLTYDQALNAKGVIKIAGDRLLTQFIPKGHLENFYVALSPSTPRGLWKEINTINFVRSKKDQIPFIACSQNFYPKKEDKEFYRVALGRNADTQTYPTHILSDEEWLNAMVPVVGNSQHPSLAAALKNRQGAQNMAKAELKKAKLLIPEKKQTLLQLCQAGAKRTGTNLKDPVYKERLARELDLIKQKNYEDYFYIIADLVNYAKKHMIVGPARGSSCGSLVCYLLNITTIDPIPYGLIFERFIDVNRSDLPDIDIDFSDTRRHLLFEYAEKKFGQDRVARLGTVGLFKARSALKQTGNALRIPTWMTEKVIDGVIERSSGDSRAMMTLIDTMEGSVAGEALLKEYPEARIAARMEGHPNNASQHAAGIVVTDEPMTKFVAVDGRTGAVMCDKKDSEDINLLKIDALGLTQLSVFERVMQRIGKPDVSGWLETIPLDDQKAFDVLNKGQFAGIFQFAGQALRSIVAQVHVDRFDDICAITALARPGPLASGGAMSWVKRRTGQERAETLHPMLTELTKETYGVIYLQEQIMRVVREMGKFSWEDTSAIRKAMSGRLGDEFFAKYKLAFIKGAGENGVDETTATMIWEQINTMGSWCLAGDTKVMMGATGSYTRQWMTISELYERYVAKPSSWTRTHKPLLVSLYPDGRAYPARMKTVYKNGLKRCYRHTFENGTQINCTRDHRFIINGKWRPIGDAEIGDKFLIAELEKHDGTNGKGYGHAKGGRYKKPQEGFPVGSSNPAYDNGRTTIADEFREKMRGKPCECCGKKHRRMEVHHKDFNHGIDRPDDLAWLRPGCHKKLHYAEGRTNRWGKGYKTNSTKLVSVAYIGWIETYDIEMETHPNFISDGGIITHNSFNHSHSVAYGYVSYWCCYLKAYWPLEFAASTLDAEVAPDKIIFMLRELESEGIGYVPVDPEHSSDRWAIKTHEDGSRSLVGPLWMIKGIGPAAVKEILTARSEGKPIREALVKRMLNAKTDIDTLYPIRDTIARLHPDLTALNIFSQPTRVVDVQPGKTDEVMIFACLTKIATKDENEAINIQKRGYAVDGPHWSLNIFARDDSGEIFCKIDRWKFETMAKKVIERGRPGKVLYAIKGTCPKTFRMISVEAIRYLGELGDDFVYGAAERPADQTTKTGAGEQE